MDNKPKTIIIAIAVALVLVAGFGSWYWSKKKSQEPKGTVETAKTLSESVPEIQTNVGEKVPEINPIDRANPFKYTNPLR